MSRRAHIVFVEDDEVYAKELMQDLTALYDVKWNPTLSDAFATLAAEQNIELLLTDLVLNEPHAAGDTVSGLQLIEQVQATRPDVPIVVLSAYLGEYNTALNALGVLHVSKTASWDTLKSTIENALSSRNSPSVQASSTVVELRRVLSEEINMLLPLKERTLWVSADERFELMKPLIGYKREIEHQLARFPFHKNVFLMMKFRESNAELSDFILETVSAHGLIGVRADQEDWDITSNVYNPIAVLYCCKYGIALFDEPEEGQAYSPNVVYELGMMHYQRKDVLILRHSSLPSIPFDLVKDLYVTYSRDLQVRPALRRWIGQISRVDGA